LKTDCCRSHKVNHKMPDDAGLPCFQIVFVTVAMQLLFFHAE